MNVLPGGLGEVRSERPLAGGSIADTRVATLADGRDVVVKRPPTDARLEAEGLTALADAGAPVPAVLHVDERLLVLEHVSGSPAWGALGERLAGVHRGHAGGTFGWSRDNVIGSLPQPNDPDDDWPRFFAERRIRPRLAAAALPDHVRRRLEAACDGPLRDLLAHGERPSLVHGDLWSGNVVDGRWLIDPAVHRADREVELAFADLFGGIPDAFWAGYLGAWPLDEGWEERRPALQFFHLLVHVELFGAGYVGGVVARLDRLGW
ncbi:MAG: fructosamine kinase family protein [Actinobacteria bacterium]|nr:fructosamine kinase family protein [Actinomycetota bacterium]